MPLLGENVSILVSIHGPGALRRTTYDVQGRPTLIFMTKVDFNRTQLPFFGSFPKRAKILCMFQIMIMKAHVRVLDARTKFIVKPHPLNSKCVA